MSAQYIPVRQTQLKFYKNTELYAKTSSQKFFLYKRSGITLSDMRIEIKALPKNLFIKESDKQKGLNEAQDGFNKELAFQAKNGNNETFKKTLVSLVTETLTEPRSGGLEKLDNTVNILISDYAKENDILSSIINMSYTDYSTVLHSINVMALAIGFAFHMNYSREKSKHLGIAALLHDIGKTQIDTSILKAPRKLTQEEFEIIKTHPEIGSKIISNCKFNEIENIRLAALEHHEKLDGSGYPKNKKQISEIGRIIAIIDCYEALTNNDRPYRNAMDAFSTLEKIIGNEVKAGKYDKDIYKEFILSLSKTKK